MALSPDVLRSVKETLLAGRYSLLIGAGASRDSKDHKGNPLPLGDRLRSDLVELKNLKPNSSLARAYGSLTQGEIDTHITDRFSNYGAGPTLLKIPGFYWRRIYSLNIDDALEAAYAASPQNQSPDPQTHKSPYVDPIDIDTVQFVHLHGWARRSEDGYIFSVSDYAKTMGPGNAWTHVLSQVISTEPFIIAGTNLEEPDLEYFLSGRRSEGVRRDRGPSFLVEPSPDAATARECERHGLLLYQGTLIEFLSELEKAFPSRPLPLAASVDFGRLLFTIAPKQRDLAIFLREFSYSVARSGQDDVDLSFFVGRKPTPNDIALGRDISRSSTLPLKAEIKRLLDLPSISPNFLLVDDNAGTGKTTIVARIAFDLASEGTCVFEYRSLSAPNLDRCVSILNKLTQRVVILCDDFADHAAVFYELSKRMQHHNYVIVGFERSYRINHVIQTLAEISFERFGLNPFSEVEAKGLILAMEGHGLTNSSNLDAHAIEISKEPIAVAVCRVMNDYRPVSVIIRSILHDSDEFRIRRYIACALARYCYRSGLYYPILSAAFDEGDIGQQLRERDRLPLSYSDFDTKNYVVPTNPILGERVLREIADSNSGLLFEVYCAVGKYIAPYVNRQSIRRRTPEARVAQRLFNYDDAVMEFIPTHGETFYLEMKRHWDWNSRYWEQFALLKLDSFIKSSKPDRLSILSQAISHARHAIKIEKHPFTLTTLGRILLEQVKEVPEEARGAFDEAFERLDEAIKWEGINNRIAIHPYMTLFSGTRNFLKQSGTLSRRQSEMLHEYIGSAEKLFGYDRQLLQMASALRIDLSGE